MDNKEPEPDYLPRDVQRCLNKNSRRMDNKEPEPDYLPRDVQRNKNCNFSGGQNVVCFHTSATQNRYIKEAQNLGSIHDELSYTDNISTDDMNNWVKWREIANEQLAVLIRASPSSDKSLTRPPLEKNVLTNIETHFKKCYPSLSGHLSNVYSDCVWNRRLIRYALSAGSITKGCSIMESRNTSYDEERGSDFDGFIRIETQENVMSDSEISLRMAQVQVSRISEKSEQTEPKEYVKNSGEGSWPCHQIGPRPCHPPLFGPPYHHPPHHPPPFEPGHHPPPFGSPHHRPPCGPDPRLHSFGPPHCQRPFRQAHHQHHFGPPRPPSLEPRHHLH